MVLVTVACTLAFSLYQTPVYSATVTYVVTPSADILNGTSFLSGLSVLGGQPTVTNTYAAIASSTNIKQKATQLLGLTLAQTLGLKVDSRVQNNTNIIEITVEGTDPLLVQAFAIKIGEGTVDYVDRLSGVYNLEILDDAKSPDLPIRPNMKVNLALGFALGLALGCGMAFLFGLKEF
jgi:capsular polysaccharide biosynthesis protein